MPQNQFPAYGLLKPLVVAEFSQTQGGGRTAAQLAAHAYAGGYAGAWVWSDEPDHVQTAAVSALSGKCGNGGLVNFSLQ